MDRPKPGLKIRLAPLLGVLLLAVAAPLGAQTQSRGALFGYIVDDRDGSPVVGAEVRVVGTDTKAAADSSGSFLFPDLPAGPVQLRIQEPGYSTSVEQIDISADALEALEVRLIPVSVMLNELVVTAKRRADGQGSSVAEVRPNQGTDLTAADLLARVPNFRISPDRGSLGKPGVVSIRGSATIVGPRAPAIYLDGIRISEFTGAASGTGIAALTVLNQIPARDVVRIRVLRGASAEARYGDSSNGVIVIETNGRTAEP